jgi:predicted Ser/Thr protein kinase
MDANSSSPVCPDCGAPLPADSPHALCAACLLRQALASQTLVDEGKPGPVSPPLTPEEIADRFPGFEILECLGRGGMGVVYKARQKSLDRWVAIKIVAPEKHGEERFAGRFAREAATLAKLSHPNIVTIHDFGETGGLFYIVMEHVDGVNLRDLVSEGRLDPEQALAIVPPICDALQYAHEKGVVHRDIKPENILLDRDGRVRIADFGIAALLGGPGDPAGTPPYAAPEQTVPNATADHRADIHALGVVFYEMLTGERPTGEIIAPSKRADTDSRLDDMVLRAMAKNPADRFQTAGDFRTAVDSVGKTPEPVAKRTNWRRWAHPAATVVLLGAVAFLSWKLTHPTLAPSVGKSEKETTKSEPKVDVSTMRLDDYLKLKDLTPEEAAILLNRARNETKSERQRTRIGTVAISILCNKGHGEEAWKLISPEPGKVRELQISTWFSSSKASLADRLARIGRLRESADRISAFGFLLENQANIDDICKLDFSSLQLMSPEERKQVVSSLLRIAGGSPYSGNLAPDDMRMLRKCLSLTAEGWLSPDEGERIFQYANEHRPFLQWDMLETVKWDFPRNAYDRIRKAILENMAAEDPERTIRILAEKMPLKEQYPFLANVYKKMHEDAPATSQAKVNTLLAELDARTGQLLIECVARTAVQSGELEIASEWMERLTDNFKRKQLDELHTAAAERRKEEMKKGILNRETPPVYFNPPPPRPY